jgi:hypothetical protein
LCDLPGARGALLPIELAAVGVSDAIGVNPYGVYLAESAGFGRLFRVPLMGGMKTQLADNLFYVQIRTGGDDAYLTTQGFAGAGSALYRITRAQALVTLDVDLKGANDLALTTTRLFVADGSTKAIYSYDRAGHGRKMVAENVSDPRLAVDGETLYYFASTTAGPAVFRLNGDGSSTVAWGGDLGRPARLLFSEGLLYAAGEGIRVYDLETHVATTISDGPGGIQELVRVGDRFYFTAGDNLGKLLRVPVSGGAPEILDEGLGWGGLATDGEAVYYDGGPDARVLCPAATAGMP